MHAALVWVPLGTDQFVCLISLVSFYLEFTLSTQINMANTYHKITIHTIFSEIIIPTAFSFGVRHSYHRLKSVATISFMPYGIDLFSCKMWYCDSEMAVSWNVVIFDSNFWRNRKQSEDCKNFFFKNRRYNSLISWNNYYIKPRNRAGI